MWTFVEKFRMSLHLSQLKNDREWSATTSVKKSHFDSLLPWFSKSYEQIHGLNIQEAQANLNQSFVFATYGDLLFFVLFVLKNPTTYDVNGLIFGISQTAAETNFKKGIVILKNALFLTGQLPLREFENEAALIAFINEHKHLKIDVTEISIQRPKNKELQKSHYSGKKRDILVKH